MSKWNKPNKEISDEFLENEERRKQMIIEAAKRRKEKERKLLETQSENRRLAEEKLVKHKLEKKEAYVKYLRNNMHDKYEEIKRNQRERGPEIKSISKWQKKSKEKDNNLEALDLQIQVEKKQKGNSSPKKISQKRKMLSAQFEKQWNETEKMDEMIGSKLLDSLDLDFGTINRQIQMKKLSQQTKVKSKEQVAIDEIKNLIGYESVLVSIDEKLQIKNNKLQEKDSIKPNNKNIKAAEVNEGQVFNELKNKKQGKIWSWAIQEQQQAEDLFSNCSSKKTSLVLKKLNQEIKSNKTKQNSRQSKNKLAPIVEMEPKNIKPANSSKNKIDEKPSTSVQKHKRQNSQSLQKKNNEYPNVSQKNITRIRKVSATGKSQSKEKKTQPVKEVRKMQKPIEHRKQLPPLYKVQHPLPDPTLMTHEHQFQIDSFIKDQLINLNEEERKIQEDLRNLHNKNKQTIKNVEAKYEVKTDYKHSNELIRQNNYIEEKIENKEPISIQDQLEESIQRLNDILLAKQMNANDKKLNQNESKGSLINPLSKPGELHQQILQLAQNISKFDKKDENADGYAAKNKMKKVKPKQVETGYFQAQKLAQSQQVSQLVNQPLCKPPEMSYYPSEQSKKSPVFFYEQIDQDLKQEKINVNQRLKKLLLQD